MKRFLERLFAGMTAATAVCVVWMISMTTYYARDTGGPETHCRATMTGFMAGLKSYQTEYNQFPAGSLGSTGLNAIYRTRGAILTTLHPDPTRTADKTNPRKITFYDPPPAKEGVNGGYFDEQHHEPVLVDPWGEPFYFLIDLEEKGKVPNPDPRDNKEHPFIGNSVIMFSAGPDHDSNTWDDNVMSWK